MLLDAAAAADAKTNSLSAEMTGTTQRKRLPLLQPRGDGDDDDSSDGSRGPTTVVPKSPRPTNVDTRLHAPGTTSTSAAADAPSSSSSDDDDRALRGSRTKSRKKHTRSSGIGLASWAVGLGLAWCASCLFLMRWLWFYQLAVYPTERWLGADRKEQGEPLVLMLALVFPFITTGLVFYHWRSPNGGLEPPLESRPQDEHDDQDRSEEGQGGLRERVRHWQSRWWFPAHWDSIDLCVVIGFTALQVNALVGKLLIDHFHGKIAKKGLLNRIGRSLGMNGLFAIILSILLVSRRSFVHAFLGLSSERAARYHVWCSNFGFVTLVLHGSLYSLSWLQEGKLVESLVPCRDCSTKQAYKSLRNFSGLAAQVVLAIVTISSMERIRRQHFRRFAVVHCLNVAFVAFTCIHYYPAIFWLLPVVFVYALYRVHSVFARGSSDVLSARTLGKSIVQLELRRSIGDFHPGQYVYVKVGKISNYEWHPFSVSSSPVRSPESLTLDIKVQGPFTAQLHRLVQDKTLSRVQLDGYYGLGIETTPNMVLVAGGSGVTPFLSLLRHWEHLAHRTRDPPREALPRRLWIIWSARDRGFLDAHAGLLQRVRRSTAWKAQIWLHCTSKAPSDEREAPSRLAPICPSLGAEEHAVAYSSDLGVSFVRLFAALVAGSLVLMALVLMSSALEDLWWVRRLALVTASAFGAAAGGSWVLYRSLQRHSGFQRIASESHGKAGTMADLEDGEEEYFMVASGRPELRHLLNGIRDELREDLSSSSHIRVLVGGPSELQDQVTSVCSRASAGRPMLHVQCHSFAV